MRKSILATAIVAALPLMGTAHAEEASPVVANVAIVSDYAYRGISQTDQRPALQGGFDYAHSSGFYIGTWASSISWLRDAENDLSGSSANNMEIDFYGGYKAEFGDFAVDVGVLQYYYPGTYDSTWKAETGLKNPNTLEGYVGLSWKFVSFKYSKSFTDLFGTPDSKGSDYLDLSAAYEVIDNLTLNAHYGRQRITGPADSYSDWKLGATYNLNGINIGLHYVDTDISHNKYADERFVLSVSKSF